MGLNHLNLAICGHAKHGKSTLAGRLLYELGAPSAKNLGELDDEARSKGRDFNKFNLLLLRSQPDWFQRKSGALGDPSRTVVPTRESVDLSGTRLTLVDTPGHEPFLGNIVYGIYLADRAIVVIDVEEFLDPEKKKISSEAERICRLLRAFDVPVLAFCVTKIDIVAQQTLRDVYSQAVERITKDLIQKLKIDESIPIIPVSAIEGTGVTESRSLAPWFEGRSVLDLVRDVTPSSQDFAQGSVRFTIEGGREVYSPQGAGTVLVGTLESGRLKVGDAIVAEPYSTLDGKLYTSRIRSMHLAKGVTSKVPGPIDELSERAVVSIAVADWTQRDARSIFSKGGVIGSPESRPKVAKLIKAEILFFDPDAVYAGKEYRLYPHVSERNGRFREIISNEKVFSLQGGGVQKMGAGELVQASIEFDSPCCIERSIDFPRLSKFVLRQNNQIVACGRCLDILE